MLNLCKKLGIKKLFFIWSSLFVFSSNVAAQSDPVHICSNWGEYSPYIFMERENGKPDESKISGATTEFLKEIFKHISVEYTHKLIPWKRCLLEVEAFGERGNYEMFTDGSFSEERAKKYYISAPIYKLHEGMWYSKKTFPGKLPIEKPVDLNTFKLCGILGNNYSWLPYYGVTAKVSSGALNLSSVMQMLSKNRCDFLFNSLEPTNGGAKLGHYKIPKDIVGVPFPGDRELTMHIFISKDSPRGYELYTKINQAILLLQYRGIADAIYRKYVPEGNGFKYYNYYKNKD